MVRFKNRYFTVEIVPEQCQGLYTEAFPLKDHEILRSVLTTTEQIHGEFGAAAVTNGLNVKYCNEHTRIAVIRARHGPHQLVASSLPFLSRIANKKVQIRGVYCGATMTKCFKFLQKYHREKLNEAFTSCKNQESKEKLTHIMSKINYMTKGNNKKEG
uniref:Ribonuclease P/MRP protein subunit POP5 n=1 Tax=Alona affinis TaxID=381656 RepID=A0A9N6WSZ9_9CRUS|nr:EOG090X0GYO [Alona affinis]